MPPMSSFKRQRVAIGYKNLQSPYVKNWTIPLTLLTHKNLIFISKDDISIAFLCVPTYLKVWFMDTFRSLTSGNSDGGKKTISAMEVWSAPTQTGQRERGSSSFVPAGKFTVYKHSAFMAERPNKKLFEDFTQSISQAVSIDLLHNDSPVIAWERALTGDWVARHIGMTKPSICFLRTHSVIDPPTPVPLFTHTLTHTHSHLSVYFLEFLRIVADDARWSIWDARLDAAERLELLRLQARTFKGLDSKAGWLVN